MFSLNEVGFCLIVSFMGITFQGSGARTPRVYEVAKSLRVRAYAHPYCYPAYFLPWRLRSARFIGGGTESYPGGCRSANPKRITGYRKKHPMIAGHSTHAQNCHGSEFRLITPTYFV